MVLSTCVCLQGVAYTRAHSLIDRCDVTAFWHVVTHSFPTERMNPAAFLGKRPHPNTELSLPSFEANIQSSSTSEVVQAAL